MVVFWNVDTFKRYILYDTYKLVNLLSYLSVLSYIKKINFCAFKKDVRKLNWKIEKYIYISLIKF